MQPVSAASAIARATSSRPSTATAATAGKPSTMAAAATGPAASEVQVADQVKQLLLQLPKALDRAEASILHDPFAALPCGRMNPMGVVLLQEMARWAFLWGPQWHAPQLHCLRGLGLVDGHIMQLMSTAALRDWPPQTVVCNTKPSQLLMLVCPVLACHTRFHRAFLPIFNYSAANPFLRQGRPSVAACSLLALLQVQHAVAGCAAQPLVAAICMCWAECAG